MRSSVALARSLRTVVLDVELRTATPHQDNVSPRCENALFASSVRRRPVRVAYSRGGDDTDLPRPQCGRGAHVRLSDVASLCAPERPERAVAVGVDGAFAGWVRERVYSTSRDGGLLSVWSQQASVCGVGAGACPGRLRLTVDRGDELPGRPLAPRVARRSAWVQVRVQGGVQRPGARSGSSEGGSRPDCSRPRLPKPCPTSCG